MRRPPRSTLTIIITILVVGVILLIVAGDRETSTAASGVGGAGWTCVNPGKGGPVCVK